MKSSLSVYLIEGVQLFGKLGGTLIGEGHPQGSHVAGVCDTVTEAQHFVENFSSSHMKYWWRRVNRITYTGLKIKKKKRK